MHKNYIIQGDLTKLARIFEDRKRVWDAISELRTKITIDLLNQHNNPNPFRGPISISGDFYFLFPKDIPRRKRVNLISHTQRPTMSSLIYFLEHIGFGILFGSTNNIAEIECRKFYTMEKPRVEIQIHSISAPKVIDPKVRDVPQR